MTSNLNDLLAQREQILSGGSMGQDELPNFRASLPTLMAQREAILSGAGGRMTPQTYVPIGQPPPPPSPPELPQEFNQYAGSHVATLEEYRQSGRPTGGVYSQQVTQSPQADVDFRSRAIGDVLARLKGEDRQGKTTGQFSTQPWEAQYQQASAIVDQSRGTPSTNQQAFQPDTNVQAQRAAARLLAEHQGTFQYVQPEDRIQDIKDLAIQGEMDKQARNVGRAQSLYDPRAPLQSDLLAGTMAAGDMATMGMSALARGQGGAGELAGLGSAVRRNQPVSSLGGDVAGFVAGGAGQAVKYVAKGAIAGAKALGVGKVGQVLAGSAGGLVGGTAAQMPAAYTMTIGEGGTHEQGLESAQNVALQYPHILHKITHGGHLDAQDALAIAFLIPEYFGAKHSIQGVMAEYAPRNAMAGKLAKALDTEIRKTDLLGNPEALAAQARESMGEGAQREFLPSNATERYSPAENFTTAENQPATSFQPPRRPSLDEAAASEAQAIGLERPNTAPRGFKNPGVDEWAAREASAAEAELASGPRRVTPEEIVKAAEKNHPGEAQVLKTMMDQEPGNFVEVDVPLSKVDVPAIIEEARQGGGGIRAQDVRKYAEQTTPAPPILGITSPNDAGKLFVADGRHRVLAAGLREQQGGGPQTIRAHVPEAWARQNLPEVFPAQPQPKPRGPKPKGLTHEESARTIADLLRRGERVDRARAMELMGAQNPIRAQKALKQARDLVRGEQESKSAVQEQAVGEGAVPAQEQARSEAPAEVWQVQEEVAPPEAVEPVPDAQTGPAPASSSLDQARALFEPESRAEQPKNISPKVIQKSLGVSFKEAVDLADQLKTERRSAAPKPKAAKPLPRGDEEVAGSPATKTVAGDRTTEVADAGTPHQVRQAIRQAGKLMGEGAVEGPQRIIGRTSRALGIGMPGVGKSERLKKNYLGWYRTAPEVTRQRMIDDLDTFAHESLGHHMQKVMFQGRKAVKAPDGLARYPFPAAWSTELFALGKKLYGSQKPTASYEAEGWAELVRMMFTDKAAARKAAPVAYEGAMRKMMNDFPEEYAAMREFRIRYNLFQRASPTAKIGAYIRKEAVGKQDAPWLARMTAQWFDSTHPLMVLKKDLGLAGLPAIADPHTTALRAQGRASGDFRVAIHDGIFDPATGRVIGKGLAESLGPVRRNMNEFNEYLTARRIKEKRSQGYNGLAENISGKEIDAAIAHYEATAPEFKQASDDFQQFNRWLIGQYAVHHGLITPEQAAHIVSKNLDYATFARVFFEDAPGAAGKSGPPQRYTQTGSGIRRFPKDSGGFMIEPPVEAFMASMEGIMTRAQRNNVAKTLTGLVNAEQAGRWLRKIDRPTDVTIMRGEDIAKAVEARLEAAGLDPQDPGAQALLQLISKDDFKKFTAGYRVSTRTREFSVLEKGKPVFYEAADGWRGKMLHDFLSGKFSPDYAGAKFNALKAFRTIYRSFATSLNPDFFVYNFPRDMMQAAVMSTAGWQPGAAAKTLAARWGGILKALLTGDSGAMYRLSGAEQAGLFKEYVHEKTKRFDIDKMFESNWPVIQAVKEGRILAAVKDIATLGPLERLNNRFELATRLGEFEARLAQAKIKNKGAVGLNDIYTAGQAAADITLDFSRGGKIAKEINQSVPFFNAAFIGGHKLYRFAKEHPVEFAFRTGAYVVLPSLIQHLMNRDNPKYWNMPQNQRDRYWHFPLGDVYGDGIDRWIRLPKPYGLGIFAVMAERGLAAVDGYDPTTGKRTGDRDAVKAWSLISAAIDQFRPPTTVPLLTPLIELITNHSFYQGGQIVHPSEEVGPESERGAERSSELAVAIGKLIDKPPPYVDYAINGTLSGLGTSVNRYVVDPLIRVGKGAAGAPPRTRIHPTNIGDYPIIRRLISEEPKTNSELLTRFYNQWQVLENTQRGLTQRISAGDAGRAQKYAEDQKPGIEGYYRMRPYKAAMEQAYKQLKATYRDDKLDEEGRRKQERKILNQIYDYARKGLGVLQEDHQ